MTTCWSECPMDVTVFRDVMQPASGDYPTDLIKQAEFFDNSVCSFGIGINSETISRDDDHHTYRYETGAIWREQYRPTFCREALAYPVNYTEDALTYAMPSPADARHFDAGEARRWTTALHDAGYFVEGVVMGGWAGIYYYLTSFENILMWMADEPEAAAALFKRTRAFSTVFLLLRTLVPEVVCFSHQISFAPMFFPG